jgi:hypothetical protein
MNAIVKQSTRTMQPVLVPTTFDQLVIFAEMAATSGMVPKSYEGKPGAIMVAVQMGSELGLSPMQSVNSIAVINGRPGVWGDGLIGLCRQSPLCQDIVEKIEGDGDNRTAICTAIRRGSTPVVGRFSMADAKRAGLSGKGIWAQYPDRMLTNRARGFALRDAFPDVLRGLKTAEELLDTPVDTFRGATIEHAAKPPAETTTRRTGKDWLDEIAACSTEAELVDLTGSPDMVKALGWFKNGALQELNAMLADAMGHLVGAAAEASDGSAEDDLPSDPP